ncbi:MAG TPA: hypothetical protein VFY13_07780 [Luteolibacter sp.]|nr:hypothetical protein [Luteolibacter sp.]
MKLLSVLIAAVALSSVSCERHDFEETRKLQEHGSKSDAHHGHDHGHDAAPH